MFLILLKRKNFQLRQQIVLSKNWALATRHVTIKHSVFNRKLQNIIQSWKENIREIQKIAFKY